jgi:hypothetical protein
MAIDPDKLPPWARELIASRGGLLNAAEVGLLFGGRQRRVVERWAVEKGCPTEEWKEAGKKPVRMYRPDQVEAWLVKSGLKVGLPRLTDGDPRKSGVEEEPAEFLPLQAAAAEASAEELAKREARAVGMLDSDARRMELARALERLKREEPAAGDIDAWQKWSGSMAKISSEMRLLESHGIDTGEQMAELIPVARAMEMLSTLARLVTESVGLMSSRIASAAAERAAAMAEAAGVVIERSSIVNAAAAGARTAADEAVANLARGVEEMAGGLK